MTGKGANSYNGVKYEDVEKQPAESPESPEKQLLPKEDVSGAVNVVRQCCILQHFSVAF